MAIQTQTKVAPFGAISVFRAVNLFENTTAVVRDWNSRRQTEKQLNALSARELEDIGITRGDISAIARRSYNF